MLEQWLARVRCEFGVAAEGVPFSVAGPTPTFASIAALIDANLVAPQSAVVPLQPHGSLPPLFLIHAGGGYVFFYRALAHHLGRGIPVYGVTPWFDGSGTGSVLQRSATIEEVAASYLSRIRALCPHGPYLVGGASLGGPIAFEIARQLRADGQRANTVFLFSALIENRETVAQPAPARGTAHRGPVRPVLGRLATEAIAAIRDARRGLREVSTAVANEVAAHQHRRRGQPLPPQLLYRCSANLKAGARLLDLYRPRPFDGRTVLFRASADRDSAPCWADAARGGLEVHDMPGGHLDMMEEPHVVQTAAHVRRHIEREASQVITAACAS